VARLDHRATLALLARLDALTDDLVIVGGQAVNFWAERYLAGVRELASNAPYTSKDIDVCGGPADVQRIAAMLRGEAHLAEPFDPGPNIGVVLAQDEHGRTFRIDVLGAPAGLDGLEVRRLSLGFRATGPDGRVILLRVMHPVLSMESRAFNTALLPGYARPQGQKQLRASVLCAREFLREILHDGHVRDVLSLTERIFRFRRYHEAARLVLERHGIDLFDAVLDDPALPEAFRTKRLPQMRAELAHHG
jgi:hypothetical protein